MTGPVSKAKKKVKFRSLLDFYRSSLIFINRLDRKYEMATFEQAKDTNMRLDLKN